jgi:hypothetical protein
MTFVRRVGRRLVSISVEVESQGSVFKASVRGRSARGGGKRGVVSGFSRGSRKRLIEKALRLRTDKKLLFVTLTYKELVSPKQVKRDLDVFVKRLLRRFPILSGLWRFGVESSGLRDYNPHLHLLLFGLSWLPVEWLEREWSEVTGCAGGFVWIELVGWRRVLAYVAKYVARVEYQDSLDFITYLTGDSWVGRFWGVFNRSCLPFSDVFTVSLGVGSWFWRLKRCGRKVWAGVNGHRYRGFTLFCDDPGQWLALAVNLAA